jgi:hypothetical protein
MASLTYLLPPLQSVFRGSRSLGPTISHSMWSRHVPQLFPSHSPLVSSLLPDLQSSLVTNLDTTTTKSPNTLPYNSLLRLHPAFAVRPLYSRKSAPSTCCDARDTTLRPQPPINTTLGSALTPTALPVLLESRLHATIYEQPLTASSTILASASKKKNIRNSLWLCSTDNKSTYSRQAYRHRAT